MKRILSFLLLALLLLPVAGLAQSVGGYPNATVPLLGTERILGDQGSGYPCINCTVNITPLQIADFTASQAAGYSILVNNNGAISGLIPNSTGTFCFEWSSLTAPPTPVSCPGGAFNTMTGGTNNSATMLVGTGAIFGFLGSSTGYVALATSNTGPTDYVATLPANTGTLAELNLAQPWSAAQTFPSSDILVMGSSTGATAIASANTSATNYTWTLPAVTDTAVGTAATQTLTNKSLSGSEINSGTVGASFLPAALSSSTSVNGTTVPATAGTLLATGANETMSTGFTLGYGSGTINANEWAGLTLPTLVSGDCLTNNGSILSWTGCGGSAAWSAVTAGTNTAALVVGSGGSLGTSGSGTIAATSAPVTGITGLGTGIGTFLATPTAANLGSAVTGAGNVAGGGIAVTGTWPTQTISSSYTIRAVTGSSDTILSTDCGNGVYYSNSGAVAVTLPQATGSFAGCGVDISASSATTVTITPTTSTINGGATAVVGPSLWDQVVALSGNYNAYGTAVSFNAGVTYLLDEGTTFTVSSGTGACATTTSVTGGTSGGSVECTGTSGASTLVITLPTAPKGIWVCGGHFDKTTTADTWTQTSYTSTSASFSGTAVANDIIVAAGCIGY